MHGTQVSQNYKVDWQFAIPIFQKIIPHFENHRQGLVDIILNYQQSHPGVQKSNARGWQSPDNLHLMSEAPVSWLNEEIKTFTRDCLLNTYKDVDPNKIVLGSSWANINEHGAWNMPHHHFPEAWAGVVYIDVEEVLTPENSPGNDNKITFLNPHISQLFWQNESITYHPKNGAIFLFPGALLHMVHPNLSAHKRISIAFNMQYKK